MRLLILALITLLPVAVACEAEEPRGRSGMADATVVVDAAAAPADAGVIEDAATPEGMDASVAEDAGSMCVPDCDNKECGDDGCQGTCGTCADPEMCEQGMCVSCTDSCDGKECGLNDCGDSCGTCPMGEVCTDNQCEMMMMMSMPILPVPRPTTPGRPMVGADHMDPSFSTILNRTSMRSEQTVTGMNPSDRVMGGYESHIHAPNQAISSDDQLVLLAVDDISAYSVRSMQGPSYGPVTDLFLNSANNPRWSKRNAHVLIHFDPDDDFVLLIQQTDVDTKMTTTLARLTAYEATCPDVSGREMSNDGRWIAFAARRAAEDPTLTCETAPQIHDIVAYDVQARRYGARINLGSLVPGTCRAGSRPRWVAPSPLGNYLVVQWAMDGTDRCNGLEVFDIATGNFRGRVTDHQRPGDLGLSPNNTQYFMTFENNTGMDSTMFQDMVAYSELPGTTSGRAAPVRVVPLSAGLADSISCQGPPGVCMVTTRSRGNSGAFAALEMEIFVTTLDGQVTRLAHHHSSGCGFWARPRASLSRSGARAMFASDWGVDSCNVGMEYPSWLRNGRVDPYIIRLR